MGFHEFTWVFGGWNHFQLGGPSWVVGGLGEVSGGYNLQNLAWTFADDVVGHSYCSFSQFISKGIIKTPGSLVS